MRIIEKGSTNQSCYITIIDSADGTPETGVTSATSGLDLEYCRAGAAPVNITESDLAAVDSAHSDGGIIHVGGGRYRVDVPDAAFLTGADAVYIQGTCTDMIVIPEAITLVSWGTTLAAILDDTGTSGVVLAADAITEAKIADNAFEGGHFDSSFFVNVEESVTDGLTAQGLTTARAATLPTSGTVSTLDAAGVRTALGMAAADLDTQLAAVATTDNRDLEEVAWLWTLKRTSTGALQSTSETTAYVHPGDANVRMGWNIDVPSVLPGKTVPATMGDPASDNADVTVTKIGTGPNGNKGPMAAKVEVDIAADATAGDTWISATITNSAGGGPITLYGKVTVLAAP